MRTVWKTVSENSSHASSNCPSSLKNLPPRRRPAAVSSAAPAAGRDGESTAHTQVNIVVFGQSHDIRPNVLEAREILLERGTLVRANEGIDVFEAQERRGRDYALQVFGRDACFLGECKGEVLVEPRGDRNFGWDAWFQPRGSVKTFAEMSPEEKDRVSHRGDAYRKLAEHLRAESDRAAGRK